MFGKKKEEGQSEKACPFTFSVFAPNRDKSNFSKCIKEACQMWDPQREVNK
ncbi:hypothetical protein L9W92_02190 [Pelotomaculum terephthalicicum JT]|uniref:hypothetical protein n=1 Tax=Pelotomaculum terephthalicicum TaxID=206393 RepID=UPI001F0347BB|nr:hypothetical protein [Pelotomaculum terephthalicicum]MCG9966869.1 hypothetical protein [Pelotomaculum terephthalicicum JT]